MISNLSILRLPISACSELNQSIQKPKQMMTFEHCGKKAKLQMLGRLGFSSPESAPPIEITKNSALVEGQTIQLWSVLLEHTYPQASFFSWSPDSMYVFFSRLDSADDEGIQLQTDAFKRSISRYDKVLFPIW
eukprot:2733862-Pyramimonas_sp.AAC.1